MSRVLLETSEVFSLCEQLRSGDAASVFKTLQEAIAIAERDGHASTAWSVDDVLGFANDLGIDMTEDEAKDFLETNETSIVDAMVERARDVLAYLLEDEMFDDEEEQ